MTTTLKAVLAGIATNFLAVPVDAAMHATGVFPPGGGEMSDALLATAFAYRFALAVAGGYVSAHVSPTKERKRNGVILGVVGVVMSSGGAWAMWHVGHHWYPLALVVISLPCSYWGASMYH